MARGLKEVGSIARALNLALMPGTMAMGRETSRIDRAFSLVDLFFGELKADIMLNRTFPLGLLFWFLEAMRDGRIFLG